MEVKENFGNICDTLSENTFIKSLYKCVSLSKGGPCQRSWGKSIRDLENERCLKSDLSNLRNKKVSRKAMEMSLLFRVGWIDRLIDHTVLKLFTYCALYRIYSKFCKISNIIRNFFLYLISILLQNINFFQVNDWIIEK